MVTFVMEMLLSIQFHFYTLILYIRDVKDPLLPDNLTNLDEECSFLSKQLRILLYFDTHHDLLLK